MLYDLDFWKAAGERAVKTFVQALLAAFGTTELGILDLPWESALSLAASAAVLSILTSLGSAHVGDNAGPSLANESTKPETVIVEVVKKAVVVKKPAASKSAASRTKK